VAATQQWFTKTVDALRTRNWPEAIYNAGVLSHYFTDPFMPFHTGQTERESIVHRACEWSISRSYDELRQLLVNELGGYPSVELPATADWLGDVLRTGAREANQQYEFLIDHYNFEVGVKNPPAGLDREAKLAVAKLQGLAVVSLARVLEQAITEAGVLVPCTTVSLPAMLATASIPLRFITSRMSDARERAQVEAMFVEFKQTGKVIENLPLDDATIRQLHCAEVLKKPLAELNAEKVTPPGTAWSGPRPQPTAAKKAKTAEAPPAAPATASAATAKSSSVISSHPSSPGTAAEPAPVAARGSPLRATAKVDDLTAPRLSPKSESPKVETAAPRTSPAAASSPEKSKLSLEHPLVDAPSIGTKTADRFAAIGVRTVGEFIHGDAKQFSQRLRAAHLTAEVLADWQDQTRLMLAVPSLKSRDVQLLVGIDIRTAEELVAAAAEDLFELVSEYCQTSAGQKALREAAPPDLATVASWIERARDSVPARAA
jgi:hypothetical protein